MRNTRILFCLIVWFVSPVFLVSADDPPPSPQVAGGGDVPTNPPAPNVGVPNLPAPSLPVPSPVVKSSDIPGTGGKTAADDISPQIAKLEGELSFLQQNEQAAPGTNTAAIETLDRELESLRRIQLLLEQRAQVSHDLDGLAKQIIDLEEQAKKPLVGKSSPGSSQGPNRPSEVQSFAELEDLHDEYSVLQLALDRANTEQEVLSRNLSELRGSLEDKEKELRRLKEEKGDQDPVAVRFAELERRLVVEDVALQDVLEKKSESEEKIVELRRAALHRQIELRSKATKLSEPFLQSKLADLEKSEQDLRNSETAARRDLPKAERQWDIVRRRLQTQGESDVGLAELDARRFVKEEIQTSLEIIGKQISLISELKLLWSRRAQIASGSAKLSDISQWKKEAESRIHGLETAIELATTRQTETRKAEFAIENKLDDARARSTESARWLGEQAKSLRKTEQDYFAYIGWLEGNYRLFLRYRGEIKAYKDSYNFYEKISEVWSGVALAWNYELFVIDDRPITASKIILALLFFILGYRLSRYLSRQIGRKILPHFHKAQGVAAALEALSFYFLVAFFALFALRVVNVPLTVFTVLGGAVAIGVGFGSQNIVNNFISGIILLVEQPVRVGDIIELGGFAGSVQHIGLRSTIVKTGRNIEVVVPNSTFLEKHVTNWTLIDDRVSISISVGVAYGSDLELVRTLLLKVAKEHGKVLAEPTPSVYLVEFGNLAICFELHFWIHLFDADRMAVQSDIRTRVYGLLRTSGVEIPYQTSALDTRKTDEFKSVVPLVK